MEVSCADRAGSSAKLAAADQEASAENSRIKLVEDCTLAALAKSAADADAARQARAARQVTSRPSSSLSVGQALHDADEQVGQRVWFGRVGPP